MTDHRMDVPRKAKDRTGCRELQHLLQAGTFREQETILGQLRGHVAEVAQSPHGNFVLQQAIRVLSSERLHFIGEELLLWRTPALIAQHKYACRVLERIVEHFPIQRSFPFIEDVVRHSLALSFDSVGHYSVQHCLEHGGQSCRQELANMVLNHVHDFAADPNACGVLNTALVYSNAYQKQLMVIALASHPKSLRNLASMKEGFAACEALFQMAQRMPGVEEQLRQLLKKSMCQILGTNHGQALLRTLAPELVAHRYHKTNINNSWRSSGTQPQQYQQPSHQQHYRQQHYRQHHYRQQHYSHQHSHQPRSQQNRQQEQQTLPPHGQQRYRSWRNQRYSFHQ